VEATPDNCNGWLPSQFWEYVNNPTKAWTDNLFAGLKALGAPPQFPRPPVYPALSDVLKALKKE
jgi:hypothetical protein